MPLKCWLPTCNIVEGNQPQHTDRLSHFISYSCKINFYIGMWLVPITSNYFLFWLYFNIWLCNITEQYVSAVRQLIQLILIFLDSNNLPKCIWRTMITPQETVNTLSKWLMLQDIAQCLWKLLSRLTSSTSLQVWQTKSVSTNLTNYKVSFPIWLYNLSLNINITLCFPVF